ncbi:MAG: type II secretion system secretin GspD [Proteobacteria bacterium]|nr:type II secretion system secretin GspD [Pseudomonadota bacterium]
MTVLLACALTACSAFTGKIPETEEPLQAGAALDDQSKPPETPAAAGPAQAGKKSDTPLLKAYPAGKSTAAQPSARPAPGSSGDAVRETALNAGSDNASSQGRGGMISLNFDNADIFEVINALSDFLDINYIIDPAIKGKVNIHTTSEVDKRQLLAILETIFEMNNISVVKQGEFYKILPSKDAQKQGVQVGVGRDIEKPDSLDRMTIQIIPLKYVPAAEVVKVIKPFSSKNGEMVEFTKSNIIILFDTAVNIQKIVKLVNIIDTDVFEQNEMRFFKIKNANVADLAKELETIFTSLGIEKATGKGIGLAIVPVERASVLVAVSPIPGVLDQVQHWVEVLDTIDKDADEQIFIYFVENGKAEEIADIMIQLYGGEGSSRSGSDRTSTKGKSSRSSSSSDSRSSRRSRSGSGSDSRSSSASSKTKTPAKGASGKASILENDIMIVTDEATNAIIVRSNLQDYAKIRETIQRLDIIPRQVLIEVFIAEVRLGGDTQFGVEWALLQNSDKLGGYKGSSKTGQNFGAGLGDAIAGGLDPTKAAGVGFTYLFQSERLQAFLIAQASENKLNILSTPNIMASDNKQARIEVGEEVPIVTSEYVPLDTGSSSSLSNSSTSRSIEYRNTGVILEVTPRINEKGLVSMDISQEVSKAQPITKDGIQSPTITNRKAETSVVVQNGQTVVIGGIINDEGSKTQSGLPYLSRIPILGYLFSNTRDEHGKQELLIMLTPRVVKNVSEAATVTDAYKEKMQEIKRLLKRDDSKWSKTYQ